MNRTEVLTQEEIDALLTGVNAGDVTTDDEYRLRDNVARSVDLAAHVPIVRGHLPALDLIGNRFSRSFRVSLFNLLRRTVDVSLIGVRMAKFGEYVQGLRIPTSLNLLKMQPLRGTAMVVIEPRLVFSLVNVYFGGDTSFQSTMDDREFTPMENRIIRMTLDRLLPDMAEAWSPVLEPEFEQVGSEINPQFANFVNPSEVVVVMRFDLDIEGTHGEIHFVVPLAMFEPIREKLSTSTHGDNDQSDERWASTIREEIAYAEVEVHATLTEVQVPLARLLALKAGDVIPIEPFDRVVLYADTIALFEGMVGVSNGNHAIQIDRRISREGRR
jgi:flagellar motor switch protein FliM